jgi:hypothetical protein
MLWGNPKSIDRIDRGIFHRGKRPAKCHIPTRSIRERYLSWRSVPIRLRSIYHTIYQPHESPANGHIEDGAGDAVGTLPDFATKIVLLAAPDPLTSTMALQSRLERC